MQRLGHIIVILSLVGVLTVDWLVRFPGPEYSTPAYSDSEYAVQGPEALRVRPVVVEAGEINRKEIPDEGQENTELPEVITPGLHPTPISDRSGRVTYYHPSLAGGRMANGEIYNPWDPRIAASMDYALGTTLEIEYKRVIAVEVKDRGLLGPGHIDLSQSAFRELLGSLEPGVAEVVIREID